MNHHIFTMRLRGKQAVHHAVCQNFGMAFATNFVQ
ncbi:Uncharacterised protein [Vibrio cholerae]|nr:Uncharacterised protein [Vibrio cholerae]